MQIQFKSYHLSIHNVSLYIILNCHLPNEDEMQTTDLLPYCKWVKILWWTPKLSKLFHENLNVMQPIVSRNKHLKNTKTLPASFNLWTGWKLVKVHQHLLSNCMRTLRLIATFICAVIQDKNLNFICSRSGNRSHFTFSAHFSLLKKVD